MKRAIKSCSNWLTNIIFHHVQCTIADRQQDDIRNFMRLKSGLGCPTARYLLSYIHARFAMQYCCSELGLNDTHLRCSLLLNLKKALRHKRFRQRSQQQVHRLVCEHWLASPPCAMHAALTPTLCQSINYYKQTFNGSCTNLLQPLLYSRMPTCSAMPLLHSAASSHSISCQHSHHPPLLLPRCRLLLHHHQQHPHQQQLLKGPPNS